MANHYTLHDAADILKELHRIGAKMPKEVDIQQFRKGLEVEREHVDITGDDPILTGAIVLSHLREIPDYYDWLDAMEKKASQHHQAYRANRKRRKR